MGAVTVRPATDADAEATRRIFLDAVLVTAAADYTPRQLRAWSRPDQRPLEQWRAARARTGTVVAIADDEPGAGGGTVVGFADADERGVIGMMFVDPAWARRGIASALLARIEEDAARRSIRLLATDASITGRRFFAARGFTVVRCGRPVRDGVVLTNFRMHKRLED